MTATEREQRMRQLPIIRSQQTRYTRESPFSYTCRACSRCCHDKIIQLNPYEVARLAENRRVTTTEFLARYTERNGTVLQRAEEGACVFLTAEGCGVHQDRPLVCRLYPLGRKVTAEGEESFREVAPHPETEGEYGTGATVEEFLARQGAAPFIEAVDRYVEVVARMTAALVGAMHGDEELQHEVRGAVVRLAQGQDEVMPEWIDMDLVVARYCASQNSPIPSEVSGKMALHIQAIEEWVRSI